MTQSWGELQRRHQTLIDKLRSLQTEKHRYTLLWQDMNGQIHPLPLSEINRAWYPNDMSFGQKLRHWAAQTKSFDRQSVQCEFRRRCFSRYFRYGADGDFNVYRGDAIRGDRGGLFA